MIATMVVQGGPLSTALQPDDSRLLHALLFRCWLQNCWPSWAWHVRSDTGQYHGQFMYDSKSKYCYLSWYVITILVGRSRGWLTNTFCIYSGGLWRPQYCRWAAKHREPSKSGWICHSLLPPQAVAYETAVPGPAGDWSESLRSKYGKNCVWIFQYKSWSYITANFNTGFQFLNVVCSNGLCSVLRLAEKK